MFQYNHTNYTTFPSVPLKCYYVPDNTICFSPINNLISPQKFDVSALLVCHCNAEIRGDDCSCFITDDDIIDDEKSVSQMYVFKKASNKPVYIGRDIIGEKFNGYSLVGRFPKSVFLNLKNYFQSGIQDWWQKHLDWSFKVKTNLNVFSFQNQKTSENNITQIYTLCLIPLLGFLLSTSLFLIVELNVCFLIIHKLKMFISKLILFEKVSSIVLNIKPIENAWFRS